MNITEARFDELDVKVFADRKAMGRAAAEDTARAIIKACERQGKISIIFAAAPSQNEYLAALAATPGIPWENITAFHMDEYIGLPAESPQSFGAYLDSAIFGKVPFAAVNYLDGNAGNLPEECHRYSELLRESPPEIVCMGIGENGHIAFNDPPVADFTDSETVKVVNLDHPCRMQQVHDGCFPTLDSVPEQALTLTIPALMAPSRRFCVVPGALKKSAVERTLAGPISTDCPASILRTSPGSVLYLDSDSGETITDQ